VDPATGVQPAERDGPLTIGIVGVGRAGAAVGAALAAAGHEITAVHVRSTPSALRAARLFPSARPESLAGVAGAADVVLLAVPDDALAAVAVSLADEGGARPGLLVVHLAGRHGLAVLDPLHARGAQRAAIHPIMTFPGADDDASRLRGASFGVTADANVAQLAARLVRDAGGVTVWVPPEGRVVYHAALSLAGNYTATLVAAGIDLLHRAGVADPASAIGPLVHAQVSGALADGARAMTGPVRRGDVGTVREHLTSMVALQSQRRQPPRGQPSGGQLPGADRPAGHPEPSGSSPDVAGLPGEVIDAYRALGLLTAEYLMADDVVDAQALAGVVALLSAYPARPPRAPRPSWAGRERRDAH
jgi:predicted short-subunit dehydrogenase-like oxidoreductase (DUF2520 family)